MTWLHKTWVKVILALTILVLALMAFVYFSYKPATNITWGFTYSPTYAQYLGLDPKATFSEMLNELRPAHVRLVTYWETLEPQQGQFNFSSIDDLLSQASQYHTDIVLVIGHKQPRWPECHHPEWYDNLSLVQQRLAVMAFLAAEVNHFKTYSNISRWQVENEPFFPYGDNCPLHTRDELAEEVALVKSLDNRPIVLTDSGEKGDWFRTAKQADVFGSTMYRTVYNPRYGGYVSYHLPPAFYRLRAGLLQLFSPVKRVIGVELQGEPWFAHDIHDTPVSNQLKLMNAQMLQNNARYARDVGFAENYYWGVEWWYWLKHYQGNSSLIEAAQTIFRQ